MLLISVDTAASEPEHRADRQDKPCHRTGGLRFLQDSQQPWSSWAAQGPAIHLARQTHPSHKHFSAASLISQDFPVLLKVRFNSTNCRADAEQAAFPRQLLQLHSDMNCHTWGWDFPSRRTTHGSRVHHCPVCMRHQGGWRVQGSWFISWAWKPHSSFWRMHIAL